MSAPLRVVEVVNGPLRDAQGALLPRVPIAIAAVIPENPYLRNGQGSVVSRTVTDTDLTGVWRAHLPPTSAYERADAYYVADERKAGGGLVMFTVPTTDGPHRVRDLLITQPPAGHMPGEGSSEFTVWWSGNGPPPEVIVGAKPGDIYVDDDSDTVYQLR